MLCNGTVYYRADEIMVDVFCVIRVYRIIQSTSGQIVTLPYKPAENTVVLIEEGEIICNIIYEYNQFP